MFAVFLFWFGFGWKRREKVGSDGYVAAVRVETRRRADLFDTSGIGDSEYQWRTAQLS